MDVTVIKSSKTISKINAMNWKHDGMTDDTKILTYTWDDIDWMFGIIYFLKFYI